MKFLKLIGFFLLICPGYLLAYEPVELPVDTIALKEIEISANKLVNFTTGAKIQTVNAFIKKDFNASNLSELLSQVTPISITSYGIAGISSASLRGMGSRHTAILWNGINLQSSMNGGFDMGSIPSILIDEINIQYGGSGALFGSGAIGGIIHLNNSLKFNQVFNVSYFDQIGSFDNYFESLKFNYGTNKFASSTRIYHKYGKNDFSYVNTQQFGKPTVKQDNSAVTQYGILQSNLFKINQKQKISTNIWAQHHYLEVPGMMTSSISEANQNTDALRLSAIWNRNGEISSWYSRFYYNYESLTYEDPLINLISEMNNYSVIGEIENKISIGNSLLLNAGINNTYQEVITKNYSENVHRNQFALFSSLKYFNHINTFAAILSLREGITDDNFNPFTFSLSSRYYLNKHLNINTNISRTFNNPTLNDLYWIPGGNPYLEPEKGWSEDLGLDFSYPVQNNTFSFSISAFNINLNNQVIWIPGSGANWSAENVEKVWSRGLESNIQYRYNSTKWKIAFKGAYSYTKSTYEKSATTEISSIGKQLMYTPFQKGNFYFNISYKTIHAVYIQNFVGKRYITKDNSKSIDPYTIGNLSLSKNFTYKKSDFQVQFKINNIWNKTYEVMAFYAMPLRYYSLSLSYNFNKLIH